MVMDNYELSLSKKKPLGLLRKAYLLGADLAIDRIHDIVVELLLARSPEDRQNIFNKYKKQLDIIYGYTEYRIPRHDEEKLRQMEKLIKR